MLMNDSRRMISENFRPAKVRNHQPIETTIMTTKTIEFANPKELITAGGSPWASPRKSTFADLVLKPEYRNRTLRFPVGSTTVRVLPPLAGSTRDWMLGGHVLKYSGGQHLHGRSLEPSCPSVFDLAYRWCVKHQPESLYSRHSPQGYKLLADPVSVFGVLLEVPDRCTVTAKWVVAGAYDGSRGGVAAFGHLAWKAFQEKDENGKLIADPSNPETCPHLVVERVQPKGAKYPSYSLRLRRSPSPIGDWVSRMEPAELEILRPLEEVVHVPTQEEEWKLLEHVMPPELVARIRSES